MTAEELVEFWNLRLVKTWVVYLSGIGKNNKTDTKIVNAKTEQRALLCAKENSLDFHNKRCTGKARLADPITDLHCIKSKIDKNKLYTLNLNSKGIAFYNSGMMNRG